jgi:hypothetical protein
MQETSSGQGMRLTAQDPRMLSGGSVSPLQYLLVYLRADVWCAEWGTTNPAQHGCSPLSTLPDKAQQERTILFPSLDIQLDIKTAKCLPYFNFKST